MEKGWIRVLESLLFLAKIDKFFYSIIAPKIAESHG